MSPYRLGSMRPEVACLQKPGVLLAANLSPFSRLIKKVMYEQRIHMSWNLKDFKLFLIASLQMCTEHKSLLAKSLSPITPTSAIRRQEGLFLFTGASTVDEDAQEISSSIMPMPELGPDDTKREQVITPSGEMAGIAGTNVPLEQALEETTGAFHHL